MDPRGHVPIWPGLSSLCLLLAGAAWAPSPAPLNPKFESKGKKEGKICVWKNLSMDWGF